MSFCLDPIGFATRGPTQEAENAPFMREHSESKIKHYE